MHVFSCQILGNFKSASTNKTCNYLVIDAKTDCCFISDVYNITSSRGTVGKFCLFKAAYRIGEEIVGTFDFSESFIPCYKVRTQVEHFVQMLRFP